MSYSTYLSFSIVFDYSIDYCYSIDYGYSIVDFSIVIDIKSMSGCLIYLFIAKSIRELVIWFVCRGPSGSCEFEDDSNLGKAEI